MITRLRVGNLSYKTTEAEILRVFGQDFRKVGKITVVVDRETGRPRGFAFVEMVTDLDARAAIDELDGSDLGGQVLRVQKALGWWSRGESKTARARTGSRSR